MSVSISESGDRMLNENTAACAIDFSVLLKRDYFERKSKDSLALARTLKLLVALMLTGCG